MQNSKVRFLVLVSILALASFSFIFISRYADSLAALSFKSKQENKQSSVRPAPASIPATECGVLDQGDSTYILGSDLSVGFGDICFRVTANNITLDLNGHTISGAGLGSGILVSGKDGFVLKNGTLSKLKYGLSLSLSKDNNISNITTAENTYGITLTTTTSSNFSSIKSYSDAFSLYFSGRGITGNTFNNITADESREPVFCSLYGYCAGNTFSNFTINHNLITKIATLATVNRIYPKDQQVSLNFKITNIIGESSPNFNYNVSIFPDTPFQATPTSGNLAVSFTPVKDGVYTASVSATLPDGNSEIRNYVLLIGDVSVADTERWYWHKEEPLHGQTGLAIDDTGSMLTYPTIEREENHCAAWVQFSPDTITNQYFIINHVSAGVYSSGGGLLRLQKFVTPSTDRDYTASYTGTTDYSFSTVAIDNMSIFSDYAWQFYWLGVKIANLNFGPPSVVSDNVHQSYSDFTYKYAGPKILNFGQAVGSDIRKIRLLSSTFDSSAEDVASMVIEGQGGVNIVVDMPDKTKTYGLFCDGAFAHGSNICTINSKDNGIVNATVSLSARHLLRIMPVTYDPADFNEDGIVDQTDYTIWYTHYGMSGATKADGDANGSGGVDQSDYTIWYNHYGRSL